MHTDMSSDAEYTSVSVALNQTVDIPPSTSAAATPENVSRIHRVTSAAQTPAATAVQTAARRFVATAVGRNPSTTRHARAITMKSGVPGGCGIPNESTADEIGRAHV